MLSVVDPSFLHSIQLVFIFLDVFIAIFSCFPSSGAEFSKASPRFFSTAISFSFAILSSRVSANSRCNDYNCLSFSFFPLSSMFLIPMPIFRSGQFLRPVMAPTFGIFLSTLPISFDICFLSLCSFPVGYSPGSPFFCSQIVSVNPLLYPGGFFYNPRTEIPSVYCAVRFTL